MDILTTLNLKSKEAPTPAQQEALLAFAAMRCQLRLLAVACVMQLEVGSTDEGALETVQKAIADADLAVVRFREKVNEAKAYTPQTFLRGLLQFGPHKKGNAS